MNKIIFSALFFLLISNTAHTQTKPSLLWGTYFGGDSSTAASGLARDSLGNIYITGGTNSYTGIATKGAYQTMGDSAAGDAFLAKFNPAGNLLWATYYGGSSYDYASGLVVDKSGNVYITGFTYSDTGIATKGAYQTIVDTVNGSAFLTKFSSAGSLLWGTYFGGNVDDDGGNVVATDVSGNVYLTGTTYSTSGVATKGAYQTQADSINADVFLAKFSSTGSLIWGTYYGGSGLDVGISIAINDTNVYITGSTSSTSGIATKGAFLDSSSGGAFLADFSANGALVWATYYGGDDEGVGLVTDVSGNIYLAGDVYGTAKGIATSGAYQTSYGGGFSDAFLAKFNSKGNLLWGTYFGGNGQDNPGGFGTNDFDPLGNLYLLGGTYSISGIATSGAYQTSFDGGSPYGDGFLAKFTPNGNLVWATYYNSVADDITTDTSDNLYITGYTESSSGIATSGAYQTSLDGNADAFLAKFHDHAYKNDAGIYRILSPSNSICAASLPVKVELLNYGSDTLKSVKINWQVNGISQTIYNWTGTLNPDSANIVNLGNYNFTTGTYSVRVWTSLPNGVTDSFPYNDTATATDTILTAPKANAGGNQSVCSGSSITIGTNAVNGVTYQWKSIRQGGIISSNDTITVSPFVTTTYYLKIISPCGSDSDSAVIIVNLLPNVNAGNNTSICIGNPVTIGSNAVNGNTYSWVSNPVGYNSTLSKPSVNPTTTTTYTLTETITATGCKKSDSVVITVNPLPDALFTYKAVNDTEVFTPQNNIYINYSWSFGDKDTSNLTNPKHFYSQNGIYTVSLTVADTNGCRAIYKTTDTVSRTNIFTPVKQISSLVISPNPFSSGIDIKYDLSGNDHVTVTIYDITGKELETVLNENQTLGKYTFSFNTEKYNPGIYMVKIQINNEVITNKIVKIN